MKKVILWDKSFLFIQDNQVAALERKLEGSAGFWLNHAGGRDYLKPNAIFRITNGGLEAPRPVAESHRLEASAQTPEEVAKIEKTKAKIRKMLQDKQKLVKEKGI